MSFFNKMKDVANIALDKGKEIASSALDKGSEQTNINTIQERISQGISNAVERVLDEREKHYRENSTPDVNSIKSIIQDYSNKNAVISGGAGLIPGPLGMAASVPEIVAVTRNQISMVYDIGKAHGHEKITTELLMAILFATSGQGTVSLLVIHGQKVMAKRVGARALQSIIKALGGRITQQAAKSMAAKWLPVAGAIAMATWSKYSTQKIGDHAIEIFSKEIEFIDVEIGEIQEQDLQTQDNTIVQPNEFAKLKIEILINLMKIDGTLEDEEIKFIEHFIEMSNLSNAETMSLIEQIASTEKMQIDYLIFKNNKEEGLHLLIDLIALAKVDGKFHITEKMFIKNIGRVLEFSEDDVKELMA